MLVERVGIVPIYGQSYNFNFSDQVPWPTWAPLKAITSTLVTKFLDLSAPLSKL